MLPNSPQSVRGYLLRITIVFLGLILIRPGVLAAEDVEMATDLTGEVGKLKGPERELTPKIESASDEGRQALARMKLPAGLVASLWAAEPMLADPVAFNFDEKGRVFVAETFRYEIGRAHV